MSFPSIVVSSFVVLVVVVVVPCDQREGWKEGGGVRKREESVRVNTNVFSAPHPPTSPPPPPSPSSISRRITLSTWLSVRAARVRLVVVVVPRRDLVLIPSIRTTAVPMCKRFIRYPRCAHQPHDNSALTVSDWPSDECRALFFLPCAAVALFHTHTPHHSTQALFILLPPHPLSLVAGWRRASVRDIHFHC